MVVLTSMKIAQERASGFLRRMRLSGMTKFEYFLAHFVHSNVYTLIQVAFIVPVILTHSVTFNGALIFVVMITLTGMSGSLLGILMGILTSNYQVLFAMVLLLIDIFVSMCSCFA